MKTMSKQSGVTLGGLMITLALIGGLAIFAMKLIPAYIEYGKIQKAFDVIVHDPAMEAATIREIKDSFQKRANIIDDVSSVNTNDIEISKEGGKLKLSASYTKKIPLMGNISLLIEFNPTAPK